LFSYEPLFLPEAGLAFSFALFLLYTVTLATAFCFAAKTAFLVLSRSNLVY